MFFMDCVMDEAQSLELNQLSGILSPHDFMTHSSIRSSSTTFVKFIVAVCVGVRQLFTECLWLKSITHDGAVCHILRVWTIVQTYIAIK